MYWCWPLSLSLPSLRVPSAPNARLPVLSAPSIRKGATLNRDVKPTSGRILVAGQDLMKIKNRKVPFLRRQIGAVFQDFKLLPQKTAYENVAFALQCIGKPKGVIRSQVPERAP